MSIMYGELDLEKKKKKGSIARITPGIVFILELGAGINIILSLTEYEEVH